MKKEHLEILLEDINKKFDLVLEAFSALDRKIDDGLQEVSGRIDQNTFEIRVLNKKIDSVAADLTAHRADTEAHHKGYRVMEDHE